MSTTDDFDIAAYWEKRLEQNWGPDAVGCLGLGGKYNQALYQVKGTVFQRTVRKLNLNLPAIQVLDIGPGTGFVIEQWLALGAKQILGVDISRFAVIQLKNKFPDLHFRQLDIGSPLPAGIQPATFDCISALDVLYHIVDDAAYRQALHNIGCLLKPGGYFLLADNFLHGPTQRGLHQVSHSLHTLVNWLDAANLHIERRMPQYVLMNYPIDSQNRFLHWWWQKLVNQVQRSSRRSLLMGRVLTPIEIALTRFLRESPTTELAVCRKRKTITDQSDTL